MQGRGLTFRLLALLLTFGVAALPAPLFASGFQLIEQNASGLGNAFAGQVVGAKDASAVFFNPAALTRVKGWNVVGSLEPIGLGFKFKNSSTTVPSAGPLTFPVALGDEGGDAGGWIPVPNAYGAGQLTDRVWVGLGVNVPFGLETDWAPTWMGRFHATNSKVQTINVNPSVAFQVNDQLSLGGGLNYQHLKANFDQIVPYGGAAYAGAAQALAAQPAALQQVLLGNILTQLGGPTGLALEGPGKIEGTSNAWGWNAGAMMKVNEQVHVGISYRSKIKHDVEGTAKFTNAPTLATNLPAPLGTALNQIGGAINARFASGDVVTHIELPETLSIGASWEQDRLELLADWTYTGWDSIPTLDIVRAGGAADVCQTSPSDLACLSSVPLTFQNTWRAGVGANLKANDQWTVRLGTAYDKSPVQNEFRTPRLPDSNRVWAAAGFQYRFSERAHLDAGYAHLFVQNASSNLVDKPLSGRLVGEYNAKVDILGVQINLRF